MTTMDWVQMFMQYDKDRLVSVKLRDGDDMVIIYNYDMEAEMVRDAETGKDWLDVTLTAK